MKTYVNVLNTKGNKKLIHIYKWYNKLHKNDVTSKTFLNRFKNNIISYTNFTSDIIGNKNITNSLVPFGFYLFCNNRRDGLYYNDLIRISDDPSILMANIDSKNQINTISYNGEDYVLASKGPLVFISLETLNLMYL